MPAVTIRDEGDVRWVTFDRPEVLNALTLPDLAVAASAARDAARTHKAVVFTGAGPRSFSAGMHVDTFEGFTPVTARQFIMNVQEFLGTVRRLPIPTLAMVNGYCIGAAFELALACDLRTTVTGARFGLPEIKLGIPSVLEARLLQDHVGLSLAREMILTGDLYPVEALEGSGVFNVVASPEELGMQTQALLDRVTGHTRAVLAGQKRLFDVWLNSGVEAGDEQSVAEFARTFEDDATRAAVAAYRPRSGARRGP